MDLSGLKGGFIWPQSKLVFLVLLAVAALLAMVAILVHVDFGGDELMEKLKSGTTDQRLAAIDELSAEGSEKAMRAIAEITRDEDTRVACRAVLAVASSRLEIGDRREHILRAAQDDRPEVRRVAMVGIGRLDDRKRDAEMLAQVARKAQEAPQVRAAALQALGKLRAWDQRHAAIDALSDASPLVRGQAAAAIRSMTGRDFHFRANDPPEKRAIAIRLIRESLR